ncbi:expressed unknown protein [Seminavis robusta]|uniref:Uncharacterized protein n=1 Tax=Seminavis robusta TaxID=568900 RepID=A0A9N8DS63_9STRA|nr:expressed unknown protein [Seminavis robusta]|eukprot:Sro314_g115080.1 n/a (146) ;mRNA; f:39746-40183
MPHLTRMLLQHNASLTSLKVRVSPGLTLEFFVEGLKTNTTLKVLQIDLIRNWGLDENDLDLFLELLERHNFTLEELNVVVPLWKEDMTKKKAERIKFLLRLNKDHQRFDILQNDATRDTLVHALALTDDLSVIVYYLDQKLSLWI